MERNSKIFTYLGFAIRARKIALGNTAVSVCKKPIFLLILCRSAAKNTRHEAENLAQRRRLPLIVLEDLQSYVGKENCKICAVLDANLAKAVLEQIPKNEILFGGMTLEQN